MKSLYCIMIYRNKLIYITQYARLKNVSGLFPVIYLLKTKGTNTSIGLRHAVIKVIFSRSTPNSTNFKVDAPVVANPIFLVKNKYNLFTILHSKTRLLLM